jgi:hypothetical protein
MIVPRGSSAPADDADAGEEAAEADREHEPAPQRVLEVHGPQRARHRVAQRKQQARRHCPHYGKLGADDDVPEAEQLSVDRDGQPPSARKQHAVAVEEERAIDELLGAPTSADRAA